MKIVRKNGHEILSPDDGDESDTTSYRILSCVAELKGVSQMDLPSLSESIDPEALDTLVASSRDGSCVIMFVFAGTHVSVSGDGDIHASAIDTTREGI